MDLRPPEVTKLRTSAVLYVLSLAWTPDSIHARLFVDLHNVIASGMQARQLETDKGTRCRFPFHMLYSRTRISSRLGDLGHSPLRV